MSTVKEISRRIKRVLGGVICLASGIALGFRIGEFVGQLLIYVLAANVSPEWFCYFVRILSKWQFSRGCDITQGDIIKAIHSSKVLFSFIGMFYFGKEMLQVHQFYFYLRSIKTQHNFKYYRFRSYFFEIDNPYVDMVYSFLYTLIKGSLPSLTGLFAGAVVFTMIFPVNFFVSLLCSFIAALSIFTWADEAVWWLLHPHRIEGEIRDVDIITGVLARKEMEKKITGQDENEDDEDNEENLRG